jgi:transcriptional regulator with GAF, ATPase, and Fis domain/serine/threonine protein kinase
MKNEYKKIKQLGKGSFATVWLAHNSRNKEVVLKEYNSEAIIEARREYLFLSALNSDSIPKAIKFQDNPPILIQEYIKGNTLQISSLKSKKQKYAFLAKLASIISHLHSIGVCYNDLKPENIIIRDDKPVLIDLGLATPNLFTDNIFRGTPAYAAPEKINRRQNTFPTDTFALGLLSFEVLYGFLPADSMEYDEYKNLLCTPQNWQDYTNENVTDNMILSALSPFPDKRSTMAQLAVYFAQKAGISISDALPDIIKQYTFQCQYDAVQKLINEKQINCNENDEPEKIIEQTFLWLESLGNAALLLKESDFIWQPEIFYQQFEKQISTEKALLDYLEKSKSKVIIYRDLITTKTKLFDQLSESSNSYAVVLSQKSLLGKATYNELKVISKSFKINIVDIPQDFAAKPNLTRLKLLHVDDSSVQKVIPSEILSVLAAINLVMPISLLEGIWPDTSNYLPTLIAHPSIRIKNDGVYFTGAKLKEQPSKKLLERIYKISEKNDYITIAAKSALLLKNTSEALDLIAKYLKDLISQEYYSSAFEVLKVYSEDVQLPISLQKQQAFLLRKNGYLKEALKAYENIETPKDSVEFAVIASDRAVILQELNRLDDARIIYEETLPIFDKTENKKSYLRTLNNIGVIHVQFNHFSDAESIFLQILEKAKQYKDNQFITMAHLNLADVFLRRGEWRKSLYQAQTAAEFGKKFKRKTIEIWAQIYGIQAQWSLGSVENLEQVILQIFEDDQLHEQTQLLENFAINMLPIMLNLNPEKCSKLFSILNSSKTFTDELLGSLFWYYAQVNNYLKAYEVLLKIEDTNFAQLAKAILSGDSKALVSLFRELGLKNDCFGYLQTAVLVQQNSIFENDEELHTEISSFASLHPFHPLKSLKKKTDDHPDMQHINILWEIISLIHSNESFETTMQSILAGVIRIAKLERAIYYSFENGEMLPKLGFNRDINPLDLDNTSVSTTILQETIKLGHIRFFEGLQEDTPFDIHSSIFGLGLRTAVCYPIIVNNEIRGVIYADATSAKDFTEQEQNLLETLFVQSRAALEKTEKIETLLKERDQIIEYGVNAYPEIIGNSKPMQKIFTLMKTVSSHNVNTMITGPTGSGKELIARALHREYNSKAPFIAVNCAAIPENLLESELFGYTKGAFTGAMKDTKGKIEAANTGTLFLDEIGDMPPALQAKLLRVLQDRIITPLGSTKEIPVSFRIVTATNQNLKDLVSQGIFREDLYFRLNVLEIELPSLAERKEDILLLAEFFMQKFNQKFGKQIKQLSSDSARKLLQNEWRGNVRELENTMEKAVLLSVGEELETSALDLETDELSIASHDQLPLDWSEYRLYRKRIIQQLDKRYTDQLLEKTNGNIHRASTVGRIPRPQIYRIIKGV